MKGKRLILNNELDFWTESTELNDKTRVKSWERRLEEESSKKRRERFHFRLQWKIRLRKFLLACKMVPKKSKQKRPEKSFKLFFIRFS